MKDLIIIIENGKQMSRLKLITSNEQRIIIEETTTYLENGEIFKVSLAREVYKSNLNMETLKIFFNTQLNALIEFYRVHGEFKIKTL